MEPPASKVRAPNRRLWPRFTLRVLLVFVTLVGIGLGYWTHRARQQARTVKLIQDGGGMVCYERDGPFAPEPRSFVVEWLAERLGRDYFEGVTAAFVHEREVIPELDALGGLENLTVYDSRLRDEDLAAIESCSTLRFLQVGDALLGYGNASMISDQSLLAIARLPNLEIAHLHGTGFTREGISALASAPKLERLAIDWCADSVQASDFDEMKRLGRVQSLVAWRSRPDGTRMAKIIEW